MCRIIPGKSYCPQQKKLNSYTSRTHVNVSTFRINFTARKGFLSCARVHTHFLRAVSCNFGAGNLSEFGRTVPPFCLLCNITEGFGYGKAAAMRVRKCGSVWIRGPPNTRRNKFCLLGPAGWCCHDLMVHPEKRCCKGLEQFLHPLA